VTQLELEKLMTRKYGEKAQQTVKEAMKEFKQGKLKSGKSGKTVKNRKQAIAIGLPAGIVVLIASAFLLAAQVREAPQKPAPRPVEKPNIAAEKERIVNPQDKGERRQEAKRVYLGVFTVPVEDMTGRTRRKLKLPNSDGVLVIEVMPDSPAEEAGLKHGDVITHVNGKLVDDEDELVKDLHQVGSGKQVNLCIFRDGQKQDIKAKLGEIPSRALGSRAGPDEDEDELMAMCEQNAERIEYLERKISRLEKRLAEMEKSGTAKPGQ
jgi:S1-C subfamily serine protease